VRQNGKDRSRRQLLDSLRDRITRYTTTQDPRTIFDPEAVREADRLVALLPDPGTDVEVCYTVGGLYWCRWGGAGRGRDSDLEQAVRFMAYVHRDRPDWVPSMLADMLDQAGYTTAAMRAGALATEGRQLLEEHARTGERTTLDRASDILARAAGSPEADPDARLQAALGYAVAQARVLDLDLDRRTADGLVSFLRGVLAEHPRGAQGMADFGALLVSTLTRRSAMTRDRADLDAALDQASWLLPAISRTTADLRASLTGTLCSAAALWLQTTGASSEIARVATLADTCLAGIPAGHPYRGHHLGTIAAGRVVAYEQTGDATHLDRAVNLVREFLATPGADQVNGRAGLLVALRHRARHTGGPADLDVCIDLGRQVVADTPGNAERLDELAADLGTRFRAGGDAADLDEAVELSRRAVGAAPGTDSRLLGNLAAWLTERYQVTGDAADLDEAVTLMRRAVAAGGVGSGRAAQLRNLAAALELVFRRTGEFAARDESRELRRRAAEEDGP
jgi:hypothetical protein